MPWLACVIAGLVLAGVCSLAASGVHAPVASARVPILMYHHVGELGPTTDRAALRYTVKTSDFAAQMNWLREHGYHAITPEQLADHLEKGIALPENPIIITFDDGWYDQYANAFPALKAAGMTATFYVYTNGISAPGYLSEAQLKELQAAGMSVQSHTISHPSLTKLKPEDAKREIEFPKSEIARRLGTPVTSFAYPYGDFDEPVVGMVRAAGYRTGVSTELGLTQTAERILYLRRVLVTYEDDLDTFRRVITEDPGPALKHPAF